MSRLNGLQYHEVNYCAEEVWQATSWLWPVHQKHLITVQILLSLWFTWQNYPTRSHWRNMKAEISIAQPASTTCWQTLVFQVPSRKQRHPHCTSRVDELGYDSWKIFVHAIKILNRKCKWWTPRSESLRNLLLLQTGSYHCLGILLDSIFL